MLPERREAFIVADMVLNSLERPVCITGPLWEEIIGQAGLPEY